MKATASFVPVIQTSIISYADNKTRYLEALAEEATDVWLRPVLRLPKAVLSYRQGKLSECPLAITHRKSSGIKTRLEVLDHGPQKLDIEGWISTAPNGKQWFIARGIKRSKVNPVLQLHLLHHQGLLTILPLCAWLTVERAKSDAQFVELPASRADTEELLQRRLRQINDVLRGKRKHYWSPLKKGSSALSYGNRTMPLATVQSLEIAWASGTELLW